MRMRLLAALLLMSSALFSKVLIITHAYNRPDFIKIQEKTFKRFLQDEYEFVVFNDARDPKIRTQIQRVCKRLQLRCFEIAQEIHDRPYLKRWPGETYNNPCVRCADVVQYSLDILGLHHDDIMMVIDSDMFLIKDFCIRDYMGDAVIVGHDQEREGKHYIWNGLFFFNTPLLPDKEAIDFNCGKLGKTAVDVGGQMYNYFQKHPEVKVKLVDEVYHNDHPLLRNYCKEYLFEFFCEGAFFHYRAGGNWMGQSPEYHRKKTAVLTAFLDDIMKK